MKRATHENNSYEKGPTLKRTTCIRAAGALAALALALPASASAVPSVTTVEGKLDTPGVTFLTDPSGAGLTTQARYVVSADGWTLGYAESNGVTGGGVIDYSVLPTDYRAPAMPAEKLAYPAAQTDVQPHATCSGVAALSDSANVLAWQGRDPSYAYVPWQKATAGLGDDPTKWIPVVRTVTGVDLATAADLRRACADLGGTYHAADTASSVADALIANATAPLQRQITTLQGQVATLTRARAASDRAAATARDAQRLAEAAYQALFTKPIALTLATKRFVLGSGVVMVTGSPTDPVDVTLEITKKKARKLGLSSPVIAEALGELDADGAALLTLKPDQDVLDALAADSARSAKAKKSKGKSKSRGKAARRVAIPATVLAVSGGNEDSARALLVR
ncbi:MAG TPA: hypothetical protein VKB03_12335 [Conexibacter sp.]|nr:hypothetical protein [Conexibacter sp.]